jgi:hypothetical protein
MNRDDFQKSMQSELEFRRQAFDRKALDAFTESVWPVARESADDADFWAAEFLLRRPDPAAANRAALFERCAYCCFWLAVLSPLLMVASCATFRARAGADEPSTWFLIGSVMCWLVSIGLGASVAYHAERLGCWRLTVGMGLNAFWGLALCYLAMTRAFHWCLLLDLLGLDW